MSTKAHSGTDIGTALGSHLHVSTASVDTIDDWAKKLLPAENDMLYVRRLGGIIYINKANDMSRPKWEKLRETDVPFNTEALLRSKLITPGEDSIEPEVEAPTIPNAEIGWYQDTKADLFYYEGEGHWREVNLKTNKKLTEMVVAGTLEFIG